MPLLARTSPRALASQSVRSGIIILRGDNVTIRRMITVPDNMDTFRATANKLLQRLWSHVGGNCCYLRRNCVLVRAGIVSTEVSTTLSVCSTSQP